MAFHKRRVRDRPIAGRITSILAGSFLLICISSLAVAVSSNEAADDQPETSLTCSIAREIAPGERQRFQISLTENQLLHLALEKGDVAIRLIIANDAGQRILETISRRYEVLDVSVVVKATGIYHIEVISLETDDKRPYQMRRDPVRTTKKAELELDLAEQLGAKASLLRDEWTERSLLQATENWDRAATIARERDARKAARALNQAGRTLFVLGQYREALKRFTKGGEVARKAGDRLELADALSQSARLLSYMGRNNEAEEILVNGLKLIEATGTDGRQNSKQLYAEALSNLGEIDYSKGNLVKSRDDFARALKLFDEVRDRAGEARVHLFKGLIAGNIGDPDKAISEISQASGLYQTVGDKSGQALCLTAHGLWRSQGGDKGDKEEAMKLQRQAAEVFHTIGDKQSQAITINSLGQVYELLGEYALALENYQQALNLFVESAANDFAAGTMLKIAKMQRLLGNLQQALASYDRCLQLSRMAGKRRTEVNALNEVARIYASKGSRKKTIEQYGKILNFYSRMSDRRGQATALNNLGDFLLSGGDKKRALALYTKALAFSELTGDKAIVISNLYNLARANRDLGLLEDALRYMERSIQIIEELRSNVETPDFRTSYFAGVHKQYDLLIDILMRCETVWPGRGFAARGFLASENARARSLIEMRAEAGADIRQDVRPELIEREREIQGLLRAEAQYQLDLSMQNEDQGKTVEVKKQIDYLKSEYQQIEAGIRDRNPRFLALKQPVPLSIRQIQTELLDQNTVVLEYALGDERSYLWVVSSTSFNSYELPPRAVLESAAGDVYKLLTARQVTGKVDSAYQANIETSDAAYFEKALNLSRMLIGPAISQLGTKRIIVVTEGVLQYIPLDALPVPRAEPSVETAAGPRDLPPLIGTHEIALEPSLSTLVAIRQKRRSGGDEKIVAVLADPVFDRSDDRVQIKTSGAAVATVLGESTKSSTLRDAEASSIDNAPVRLAHAAEEAEAITAVVPRGSAMLAQGFEANRETAISSLIGGYRIVHFATHGFVNKDHPELSGIVLSMVDRSGNKTNGFVPVRDIYNLNLSGDLVVLSACDTALGKDIKGEGFVGLTHGFMAAGSRSVVASLWKVDDRATSVLMAEFYKAMLQDGLPPAAALRSAKEKVRQQNGWQAPYFWAGFVLQGEYNERIVVKNKSADRTALAILSISALILLGFAILNWRNRRPMNSN
jgi:CHAT domain-containing protein